MTIKARPRAITPGCLRFAVMDSRRYVDVVTFKYAMLLKSDGFPQPEPEAGQYWYGKAAPGNSRKGSLCVLTRTSVWGLEFRPVSGKPKTKNDRFFVFAPTIEQALDWMGFYDTSNNATLSK